MNAEITLVIVGAVAFLAIAFLWFIIGAKEED